MIFHFTIFFWSLVFFLGLQVIAWNPIFPAWNWYAFSILPLIVISLFASKRLTGSFSDSFLPGVLSLTVPMLLSLIDAPAERQAFVGLSTFLYYGALLGIYRLRHAPTDQTAQAMLNAAAIAAMFFFFAGVYGFYLNFEVPLIALMLLCFTAAALVCYSTLVRAAGEAGSRDARTYSLLVGLVVGELIWVMSFWPFGYLTTGAVLLIFFFLVWDIAFDAFRQSLSLKKAVLRIVFFFGLIGLLLGSSPWRILV